MSAETIPALPAPPTPKSAFPTKKVSVEEYREMERWSEVRLEYVEGFVLAKDGYCRTEDGQIHAMSGETPEHNRIALNISILLDRAFENRSCQVYIENIKVRVSPRNYRYPDIAALCGDSQFDTDSPPALLNPSVLIEVLSPSTKRIDQIEKFMEYRQILTLTDYILVAQERMDVVHYARQSEAQWLVTSYAAPTDTLTLEGLQVFLTLTEIYRKVVFPSPNPS